MTQDRDDPPTLTTSRVRGGRSPWLVAMAGLAVLGVVVYAGVSGRDAAPVRSVNPRPVAAAPTSSPGPSAVADLTGPTEIVADPTAPRPDRFLGTQLDIAGKSTLAVLTNPEPGQMHAAYRVPLPAAATTAIIRLVNVTDEQVDPAPYGSWEVPVGILHGGVDQDSDIGAFAPTVLVETVKAPNPDADSSPLNIARNGYGIQVTGQREGDAEIVYVDLSMGSNPTYPDEAYELSVTAGGRDFLGDSEASQPGHILDEILMPAALQARKLTLTLNAVSYASPSRTRSLVLTQRLSVPRAPTSPLDEPAALIIKVAPNESGSPFPGILVAGYQLLGHFTIEGNQLILQFELLVNPTFGGVPMILATPGEAEHHRWITGDDGLVGWPPAAAVNQ